MVSGMGGGGVIIGILRYLFYPQDGYQSDEPPRIYPTSLTPPPPSWGKTGNVHALQLTADSTFK